MQATTIPIRPSLPTQHIAGGHDSSERSLGPDAVRAIAAFLVVYLHACVPYLVHPMPNLVWAVTDSPSHLCDWLFWMIEIFIMPLFLVVSGFYAYRALGNHEAGAFIKSRARRLLKPLVFGVLVILPFDFYVWMLGLVSEGHFPMSKMRSLKVPPPFADNLWGLSHLWFLLYVFLYSVVLVAWVKSIPAVPLRYRSLACGFGIAALGAVGVATLSWAPEVVYDFQHATLPVPSKWIYSGTFFAGGVALAIFDPGFRRLNRWSPRTSLVGLLATIASVLLGTWALRVQTEAAERASVDGLARVAIGLVTVLAAWTVTLGLLGTFDRLAPRMARFPRLVRVIQYLAGASFWIYLIHHPVLGLVQTDLKWLAPDLSPFAKSVISLAVACAWALASYEWMIRTSRFGRWIGVANPLPSAASRDGGPSKAASEEPSHIAFPGGDRDKSEAQDKSGTHRRAA